MGLNSVSHFIIKHLASNFSIIQCGTKIVGLILQLNIWLLSPPLFDVRLK